MAKKMAKRMFDVWVDCMTEEDDDIDSERKAVTKEKLQLLYKQKELEDKLGEVTSNTYTEIGKILNELIKRQNELLEKAYSKCKKWLDDNNMPYKEDGCEDCDDCEDDW